MYASLLLYFTSNMFFVAVLVALCNIFVSTNGHITYIAIRLPLKGNRSEPGSPWPQPVSMETKSRRMTLDPLKFEFTSEMMDCDIISNAIKRYHNILKLDQNAEVDVRMSEIKSLHIKVQNGECPGYPHQNMNESYTLDIKETSSTLSSFSVWGALRGLETFSQLVYVSSSNTIYINQTHIEDKPRFKHRGVMLDTARHYLPVWIILKNLDVMSYNKMNVFHWHIVDDQSFPYQSKKFPDLSLKGAYSSKFIYSQADVKRIIDYARLRGIRIIPEFDTPGHTQSWGKSVVDLLTPCWEDGTPGIVKYNVHGEYEIVNPTLNSTYKFLKEFLQEIVEVFPDKFVHLGMDEAYHACWATNPNISDFMEKNGIPKGDYSALEQFYIKKVLKIVENLNQSYVIWQDPIDHGAKVKQDAIIEVWKGNDGTWTSHMNNITNEGHQVILSSCWYLNYISYGQDWRKYYSCDPLNFPGTEYNYERVLGGEVCMWAEYIDQTNLLSRLWPRASAAAERLWSDNSVIQDTDSAAFRLDQHRCRMVKRGIPAEPILDGYCGDYELEDDNYNSKPQFTQPKKTCKGSVSSLGVTYYMNLCILFLLLAIMQL